MHEDDIMGCLKYPDNELFASSVCSYSQLDLKQEQAGAELCQAQVKLGLAKIENFFHLIENVRST